MTPKAAAKKNQGPTKGRVLVIDDDPGMRSLLSDVLGSLGYVVQSFSGATGALQLLAATNRRVDAVICDLNMPNINGLSFLGMIKSIDAKIPVILITAFGTQKIEQDARIRGAFGYLSKPFQLTEISALLQEAVERAAS